MLPKEKAEEFVNNMLDKLYNDGSLSFKRMLHARAVECALVCVKHILSIVRSDESAIIVELQFWEEVEKELLNEQDAA